MKQKSNKEYVDPKQFIELEEELSRLKKEHGIYEKPKWWVTVGYNIVHAMTKRQPVSLSRKKYVWLGILLGFVGAHRFYAKQYVLGVLYLLFFWTGIPFAMALIDLMIVLPMKADEYGKILI